MYGLLSSMVVLLSTSTPCFVPTDQTVGWKRVDLPGDAPALAAPQGVDQFRTGEPAMVFEEEPHAYLGATDPRPGKTTYSFRVPAGTSHFELGFTESLRSAKVDVFVYAGSRLFPVLKEKRIAGDSLTLDWKAADVDYIEVSVHHHFRQTPSVQTWRSARTAVVSLDPSVPDGFRLPRSLYYRHPGGRSITLCQMPGQRMELDRRLLTLEPPRVTLTRQP